MAGSISIFGAPVHDFEPPNRLNLAFGEVAEAEVKIEVRSRRSLTDQDFYGLQRLARAASDLADGLKDKGDADGSA